MTLINLVGVILDADKLSKDSQHALRRTMEKYSQNLRLILCCNSLSRLILPIRSRCINICVPALEAAQVIFWALISVSFLRTLRRLFERKI